MCGSERDIHKVGLKNPNIGSTLKSIAKNFLTFAEVFAQVENNFLHMPILNKKLFGYGNLENNIFDDKFFEGWADIDYTQNITWSSLIENENLMSIENLQGWAQRSFPFRTLRSFLFKKENISFFSVLFSSFWRLMRPKRMLRSF